METLESLDIKEAAVYLDRSERSVRRYLHAGRLEYTKEPLSAGGFKYIITAESLELLRSELDTDKGGHAGVDMSTSDGLTEHLQGLQATVQVQAEQIGKLTEQLERQSIQFEQMIKLLPPAPGERQATWWRRLFRR